MCFHRILSLQNKDKLLFRVFSSNRYATRNTTKIFYNCFPRKTTIPQLGFQIDAFTRPKIHKHNDSRPKRTGILYTASHLKAYLSAIMQEKESIGFGKVRNSISKIDFGNTASRYTGYQPEFTKKVINFIIPLSGR